MHTKKKHTHKEESTVSDRVTLKFGYFIFLYSLELYNLKSVKVELFSKFRWDELPENVQNNTMLFC